MYFVTKGSVTGNPLFLVSLFSVFTSLGILVGSSNTVVSLTPGVPVGISDTQLLDLDSQILPLTSISNVLSYDLSSVLSTSTAPSFPLSLFFFGYL